MLRLLLLRLLLRLLLWHQLLWCLLLWRLLLLLWWPLLTVLSIACPAVLQLVDSLRHARGLQQRPHTAAGSQSAFLRDA